jgi:putative cell wall-binding protein
VNRLRAIVVALVLALAGSLLVPVPALAASTAIEGSIVVEGQIGGFSGAVVASFVGTPTDPDSTSVSTAIQSDGTYYIELYEAGSYRVCLQNWQNWEDTCWSDGSTDIITVASGQTSSGNVIHTTQLGGITGTLRAGTPSSNSASTINLVADLYREGTEGWEFVRTASTGGIEGNYSFNSLPSGNYSVGYRALDGQYSNEYWNDSRYWPGRTVITVVPGPSQVLALALLSPRTYDRLRLAGPDRFATAVAVSRELFPGEDPDVPVIYIANGLNYPDALAAGPAASYLGGGLLLVTPTSIPEVVAEELERLQPDRIVVVGGTPSVSAGVKSALEEFSADVDRIGGADRFATSRMIVADAWGDEASEHAFIATGLNFPDALAAVPAAGVRGAPIILVPGTAASLDTTTRNLLTGLEVEVIHLVGSAATVSTGIESSVISLVGADNYVRYAGFDRFATAVLVSIGNFGVAENAFVATGLGFADALAGGPLAAASGSPMYLSNGTCLYNFVMSDIEAVGANRVVLLGSAATLSTGVYNLDVCGGGVSAEVAKDLLRLPEGVRAE